MKVLRLGMGMREGFHSGSGVESGQFVHHSLGCVCSHSDVTCNCSVWKSNFSINLGIHTCMYMCTYMYYVCIRCKSIKHVHVNVECKYVRHTVHVDKGVYDDN